MLKTAGALFILTGGVLFCLKEMRRRRAETQELSDWLGALEQMESEIRCKNAELPDAMGQISGNEAGEVLAQILCQTSAACPLQEAWAETVRTLRFPELAEILTSIRLTGDKESVLGNLRFGRERLKNQLAECKSSQRDKNRLLWATTFSGAGLLVILLL